MAALCAAAAFPQSSAFDLRSVTVQGETAIPPAEVLQRAGITPGMSAFRVNEEGIRHRLLEDPRIQTVAVAMVFPRRLTLVIRDRPPVAALALGDAYVLLGANGVAIASVAAPGPLVRVVADRLVPGDVKLGAISPSPDVRLGARIAATLPDPVRDRIAAVHLDPSGEAILEMRDGVSVRLGEAWGMTDRLAAVPRVLDAIAARGMRVQYVDLRFSGNVIVRPAGSPTGHSAAGGRQENSEERGIQPVMHRPSVP